MLAKDLVEIPTDENDVLIIVCLLEVDVANELMLDFGNRV